MPQETWLKYQTEAYKKAWPKPSYMAEKRETVYVRDGGEGSLAALAIANYPWVLVELGL